MVSHVWTTCPHFVPPTPTGMFVPCYQWAGSDMSCIWESIVSLRVYPMGFEKWAEQLLHVVRTDWLSALPVPVVHLFLPLMLTCSGPLLSLHFHLSHSHLFRVTPCGASLNRFLSLGNSYLSPSCLFITWEVLSCQPKMIFHFLGGTIVYPSSAEGFDLLSSLNNYE